MTRSHTFEAIASIHPVNCFMGCFASAGSQTTRVLEISLKDRFQDELQCTLDYAVADRRDREDANFLSAAILRDFLLPIPHADNTTRETNSLTNLLRGIASTPLSSMASNVTPSLPGAPLFFLASR